MAQRLIRFIWAEEVQSPRWALIPTVPGARSFSMLGWVLDAPPLDAGMPDAVSKLLVRTLCRLGTLTFLHPLAFANGPSSAWTKILEGWACVLRPSGLARWFDQSVFPLICTNQEPTALRLFDAEGFAWELQGQVVILTRSQCSPPRLSQRDVHALLGRKTFDPKDFASRTGACGLLVPAVDGDFAGWIACDEAARDELLKALEQSCNEAGIPLDRVSEAELSRVTWFLEPGAEGPLNP